MHVQSCCFANQSKPEAVICFCLNLLLFCRSRCRHRRHCLTLITPSALNVDSAVSTMVASAFFFKTPSYFWIPLYYRLQQKTKTVTHFPNYPLRNSWFTEDLMSHEPTQRITIFLTSCHVSPPANRDFFLSFFVFKSHVTWAHTTHHDFLTSCQVSPHSATFFFFFVYSLITWVHTAHHDFFNFMSRESNNESRLFFLFFFCLKSHVTWAHTAHHDFFTFMSGEPTQRNIFFLFCA